MTNEPRQKLIDRLIGEREKRTAAEAERYRDKQMDEPTPAKPNEPVVIAIKYSFGSMVVLKVDVDRVRGVVTGVDIHPCGFVYHVRWGDTRCSTPHYEFELEEADDGEWFRHASC